MNTYLTTKQVAEIFPLSVAWLERARQVGNGPLFIKVSPRKVLYSRAEIERFLAERGGCWMVSQANSLLSSVNSPLNRDKK
jgi:hypothetical protein